MGLALNRIVAALLIGGAAGGGGGSTTNVLVSNRSKFPTATNTIPSGTASQKAYFSRSEGTTSDLVFVDVFWWMGATFTLQLPAGTYTMAKYLEYPQGTFTQITYASASTITLSTSLRLVKSDPCPVQIPPNTEYWVHTVNAGGASASIASQVLPATASVLGIRDAKYVTTGFAPAHQAAGEASTVTFGSVLISGTVAAAGVKSPFMVGDSIPWGAGDITSSGAKFGTGYMARALDLAGIGHATFAVSSMSAFDLVALLNASNVTIDAYFTEVKAVTTDIICMYIVNDLRLGRTEAQLLADWQTIYAEFPGKGIHQITGTPRSDTTDAYATTANQTPKVDGNYGELTNVNTTVRAGLANVTSYIEVADLAMPSRNANIWTAPPAATTDGTHPNSVKTASMAAAVSLPF